MEAIPENDSQGSGSTTSGSQPHGPSGQPQMAGPWPSDLGTSFHASAFGGAMGGASDAAAPLGANDGGHPPDPNERLTEILVRISGADPSEIRPEARLIDDIGIDSLGFYEILIEADECLGIKIREEDLLKFRTVGDIQKHLRQLYPPDAQAN